MLNGLDLFSGIGGITLALSPWVKPIAYCENDRYAQAVLLSRMHDGHLPWAPIWDDVQTLGRDLLPPHIDIVYGGFPCQDISVAGAGRGLAGKRSGLFFEVLRLATEIRPALLFLENVPAIRTRGAAAVCESLAAIGYDLRWDVVSAEEIGAPHKRQRWFLLALKREIRNRNFPDANLKPLRLEQQRMPGRRTKAIQAQGKAEPLDDGGKEFVANAQSVRSQKRRHTVHVAPNEKIFNVQFECGRKTLANAKRHGPQGTIYEGTGKGKANRRRRSTDSGSSLGNASRKPKRKPTNETVSFPNRGQAWDESFNPGWWEVEPNVGRVVDGLPLRVDRLKGLGNAVVPLQAREAFKRLIGLA